MSIRRFICMLFGHRWDKSDFECIGGRNNRGCTRCWALQLAEQVGEDGFRWRDYP